MQHKQIGAKLVLVIVILTQFQSCQKNKLFFADELNLQSTNEFSSRQVTK